MTDVAGCLSEWYKCLALLDCSVAWSHLPAMGHGIKMQFAFQNNGIKMQFAFQNKRRPQKPFETPFTD
jgi:hypothetical protein